MSLRWPCPGPPAAPSSGGSLSHPPLLGKGRGEIWVLDRRPSATPASCSDTSAWPHTTHSTPCNLFTGLLAPEQLVGRQSLCAKPSARGLRSGPRSRRAWRLSGERRTSVHIALFVGSLSGVIFQQVSAGREGNRPSVFLGRESPRRARAAQSLWEQRPRRQPLAAGEGGAPARAGGGPGRRPDAGSWTVSPTRIGWGLQMLPRLCRPRGCSLHTAGKGSRGGGKGCRTLSPEAVSRPLRAGPALQHGSSLLRGAQVDSAGSPRPYLSRAPRLWPRPLHSSRVS